MIIGLVKYNDRNCYYKQSNNPTEQILKKEDGKDWLVSCGPTAIVNILASRGDSLEIKCPGSYKPQPEEVLTDYFNDPVNYEKLLAVRKGTPPDEWMGQVIPQFYEKAVYDVFNVKAYYKCGIASSQIERYIKNNIGVMLCLKKPAHFIAVVGYDTSTYEIIYNDPWPGNKWPVRYKNKSGFNRKMTNTEFESNVKKFHVAVGE